MGMRKPTKTLKKLKKEGKGALSPRECCDVVFYQLEKIAEWEAVVWDKIWGSGGGGTPPPPPKWPPE